MHRVQIARGALDDAIPGSRGPVRLPVRLGRMSSEPYGKCWTSLGSFCLAHLSEISLMWGYDVMWGYGVSPHERPRRRMRCLRSQLEVSCQVIPTTEADSPGINGGLAVPEM
jgi:hypothetical protein